METVIEPIKYSMESAAQETDIDALFFEGHRFFPIDGSSAPPKGDYLHPFCLNGGETPSHIPQ